MVTPWSECWCSELTALWRWKLSVLTESGMARVVTKPCEERTKLLDCCRSLVVVKELCWGLRESPEVGLRVGSR
ncbi:predicted protein [Arabidopsis lyrata subsp. lyrata]|uniref:Predicted protein n=1 Tax=Arabidopsis lyrata subsp. lyrata TaxID=81972 RepID=D7KFP0_ARALL|nr:predicted protein [Arabidopsis lyrata subsp. lyrata]